MGKDQQLMTMIKDEMPQIMRGIDEQMAAAKAAGNTEEIRQLQAVRAELAQVDTNGLFGRLVFDLATFTLPEASIIEQPFNEPPFVIWPKIDARLECCLAEPEFGPIGTDQTNGTVYDPCGCGSISPFPPQEIYDLKACGYINWYLKFCLNTTLNADYEACGSPNYLPFTATGTTCVDHVLCGDQTNLDGCPDFCNVQSIAIRCKTCPLAQLLVDNKQVVTYLIIFLLPPCDIAPANGAQ